MSEPAQENRQLEPSRLVVSTTPLPQLYRQPPKHSAVRTCPEAIDHRLPRDNSGGPQELNEPRPFCDPNDVREMTEQDGHSLVQANHDPSTTTQMSTVPTAVNDDDVQQCVEEQDTQVKGTHHKTGCTYELLTYMYVARASTTVSICTVVCWPLVMVCNVKLNDTHGYICWSSFDTMNFITA